MVMLVVAVAGGSATVGIEVVQEPEEGVEGGRVVGDECSREERHCAVRGLSEDGSLSLSDWKS